MKLNIIHIAASRFFNLAISTSIIGAMLSLTLLSISQVRSQVEVFMMEADVANLRWELRELWTHRNATGQSVCIAADSASSTTVNAVLICPLIAFSPPGL